ncbi:MAG: Cell division protein FtsA [Alphaproteobacteria bacterium MarineAlpha9_Bin4]|nr:cell division protein FtsA [Pelagibacterales bacterium]PPR27676.1 MAG: Cell division protein FtsA [Alphaproteobacteria bacterium MarineAlpha9_Bin4]
MSSASKYLASLDIGSSKICCIIATKDKNEIVEVVGIGYNEAKGVNNGIISDFSLATKSISNCISEAERQANIKIDKINISASSKIVTTRLFKKNVNILDERIEEENINETLNLIMKDTYFEGKQTLHAAPISYTIDGANGIKNPIGMYGSYLEIDFVISTMGVNHYRNYIECVTKCNIDIDQVIFSGLASGVAVLNENEISLGSVVLDLGATTTSLSIFSNGNLLFSEVINFGGSNITEAIARYFGISFSEAEKIKIMHASAIEHSSDNNISFEVPSINFDNNEKFVQLSKKDLHKIIKPYVENIMKWTKLVINKSGYDKTISNQLVLTGGGSQLDGLSILIKNYLNFNSRIGFPKEFKINLENTLNPCHSVALGIVQSIFKVKEQEKKQDFNILMTKKNKFSFLRNWMSEKFY